MHVHASSVILGVLVALLGTLVGVRVLRRLVRAGVPWWRNVAPFLLSGGIAAGFYVSGMLDGAYVLELGTRADWRINLAWSLAVLFGVSAVFGIARAFLRTRVVMEDLQIQIPDLVLDGVRYLLWLLMIFVIVGGIWGRTDWFTALFTASAVGTVILGLALQDTLANFFAGMSLVAGRIYKLGDWVWVGEVEGKVIHITRRSTTFRIRSGDLLTLPNRAISQGAVRNPSQAQPAHGEFVELSAPYDAPPNLVRDLLCRAALASPSVLREPAPLSRLLRYGDSGIDYELKFWTNNIDHLPDVRSEVLVHAWYLFQRAGVSFPYPVREWRRHGPGVDRPVPAPDAARRRLAGVDVFAALPARDLDGLSDVATIDAYGAGEDVLVQGERGETCFVVDEGRVAVIAREGEVERQVATLGPGSLFGEMGLLTGEVRSATVRALGDVRLLRIDAAPLKALIERSPELDTRLAEAVVMRREHLVETRSTVDPAARSDLHRETIRLREAIRRFLRLR